MAGFPENDVQILQDYLSDSLMRRLGQVAEALGGCVLPPEHPRPVQGQVRSVNLARGTLLAVLRNPSFAAARTLLREDEDGTGAYNRITQTEYQLALQQLAKLSAKLPPVSADTVELALRAQALPFTFIIVVEPHVEIDPDTGIKIKIPGGKFERKGTLKGYAGPALSAAERAALVAYCALAGGGPERDFRLGLLRAECHIGLGDPGAGLNEYGKLLVAGTLDATRRRYVAIRASEARLLAGDRILRQVRVLDEDRRVRAGREYDRALALLNDHGVPPLNPLRVRIEGYAAQQKAKLDGHFNVLGFRDSFVPVQVHTFLESRARQHIDAADDAANRFERYLSRANELEDLRAELNQELAVAQANEQIAAERIAAAQGRLDDADNELLAIGSKQDFLVPSSVLGGLESLFSGASFGGIFGIGRSMVDFAARREELAIQRAGAEIDRRIAEHELTIAGLEAQVAASRRQFVDTRLTVTGGRQLDQELYYALARTFEELALAQLETAILFAYLYERAVAYFIGKPGIRPILFNYMDPQAAGTKPVELLLRAPATLRSHLEAVTDELAKPDLPKPDAFVDQLSLRELFPIEFAQLQQSGQMDFALSLYELDKRRPGSWQARLSRVEVEVVGLIPPTGFSGNLTHMGRFLVRDRAATLDPAVDRLLPTAEQVAEALARQERGEVVSAAVGGVVAFDLGPDTKELDARSQTSLDQGSQKFQLDLIEGYGPAGLWRLQLRGLNLAFLADVVLTLHLGAFETDIFALQPKVLALIDRFETEQEQLVGESLDRILVVSLRQRFPAALAVLAAGPATVELAPADFPGLAEPRVKTVVAQALDAEDDGIAGVGLEIARADTGFAVTRTTGAGGFSEDLSGPLALLEPGRRFPAAGAWRLRLSDPGQAAGLGDLRLFVLHDLGSRR